MDVQAEITAAAAKASPPFAVVVAHATGWGIEQWMYAATIGYIVLQAIYLAWKWKREKWPPPHDENDNDIWND